LALLKTNVITTVLSANFGDKIGVFLEKQNNTMITIVLLKYLALICVKIAIFRKYSLANYYLKKVPEISQNVPTPVLKSTSKSQLKKFCNRVVRQE
jgi:hypothetical protein